MPLKRFRALIFDLDGTLLDSMPDIMRVGNSLLRRRGMPLRDRAAFMAAVGMGLEELYRRILGPDAPAELVEALAGEARQAHGRVWESTARPYPGIVELLTGLSRDGYRLGVLSNKPHEAVTGSVERFFHDVRFDDVRGELHGRPTKPGGAVAVSMLLGMGVEPGEAAMIGDGEPDMQVAIETGMEPVACAWGFTPRKRLAASGARHMARDPRELEKILRFLE